MAVTVTSDDSTTLDDTAFAVLSAARAVVTAAQALAGSISPYMATVLSATDEASAQDPLGLLIGRDVQAHDPKLDQIAGLVPAPGAVPFFNDDGVVDLFSTIVATRAFLAGGAMPVGQIPSLDASKIGSGVFDIARIPVLPSQTPVVSSGDLTSLTSGQQAQIVVGTVVTTTDGYRYVYSGSGSKTNAASYVTLADITPDWSVIANRPTTFPPSAHTHLVADLSDATAKGRSFIQLASEILMLQFLGIVDANGYLVGDGRNLTNLPTAAPVYRQLGDAAATLASTDRTVALTTALTAPRTWTLPAASAVPAGTTLRIADQVGGVSSTNTLTLSRAGSDLLNGATSHVISSAYAEISLVSDGSARWTFDVRGVARGGTGANTPAGGLAGLGALAKAGDTLTGALNYAAPATLASASTVAIGAATSNVITITGTTAITAFDTIAAGATRILTFASAGVVLTYNATSLIIPTLASITTQAGDVAEFVSLGSGNWRCVRYQRADGTALAAATAATGPITGIRTITAADTIVASDKGKLLVFSGGGTFTVALTAVATLAANFYCYVQKLDGAGTVTLDPNGTETIDGRTTISVYQESFTITGDGTAFRTVGRQRGWILLGRTVLTGQTLSALTISQGFADAELSSILCRYQNLNLSGSTATVGVRVTKNGSLVTASSYAYAQWYNQGSAGPSGDAGTAPYMPAAQVPSGPASGEICFSGIQSAAATGQSISIASRALGSPSNIFMSGGYESSNFLVQSFNIYCVGGQTISSITFNLWGERQ